MESIASRNWFVVRYLFFLSINIAKSLVIAPSSTALIQIFSKVLTNFFKSSLLSNFALWYKPLAQAKIEAIGFVEVSLPCWCSL